MQLYEEEKPTSPERIPLLNAYSCSSYKAKCSSTKKMQKQVDNLVSIIQSRHPESSSNNIAENSEEEEFEYSRGYEVTMSKKESILIEVIGKITPQCVL